MGTLGKFYDQHMRSEQAAVFFQPGPLSSKTNKGLRLYVEFLVNEDAVSLLSTVASSAAYYTCSSITSGLTLLLE